MGDDSFGVDPLHTTAQRKRAPFLPVFGAGAITFIFGLFTGVNVDHLGFVGLAGTVICCAGELC